MELDQYLGLFIDESKENLQKLNDSLLALESDTGNLEILNDIFRVAHTLKGMSKTMGFNNVADVTHHMENLLEPLRSGTLSADTKIIDILFKCLDMLDSLINNIADGVYEDNENKEVIEKLVRDLESFLNPNAEKSDDTQPVDEKTTKESTPKNAIHLEDFNEYEIAIVKEANSSGFTPKELIVYLTNDCVLPGVRAYMVSRAVEDHGEIIKTIPTVEELENAQFEGKFKIYLLSQCSSDGISTAIYQISEIEKVEISDITFDESASADDAVVAEINEADNTEVEQHVDISSTDNEEDLIKAVEAKFAQQSISQTIELTKPELIQEKQEQMVKEVATSNINELSVKEEITNTSQNTNIDTEEEEDKDKNIFNKPGSASKILSQTVRVSADRIDQLMNLVGELVISRTRINQISGQLKDTELVSSVGLMGNITTDIQEIVMKLRMVPMEQVFNRFPRLVRDLAKDLNKEVNLKITGKDTEIDRVVIDEIGDPMVHLIRNSMDHGLENPEDRIKNGKKAKGTLELSAFNEGENIIIKVTDDGKGIDPEKVKESAINKGILTREAAKNLTQKQSLELIFAPGFSTATVTTDVSGRGVGMDVVKSKIASLGGNVTVNSTIGKGTTTIISLPSSMAIVQALLIKVGEEIYAAPLNYISEVINIEPDQVKNIQKNEVIVLRGKTLPLVRLHDLLEVENYVEDKSQPLTIVVIKSQNKYSGIIVSELIGQQEIVIKPINKKLCKDDYISGATTLGNGQVALIINVNSLFKKV